MNNSIEYVLKTPFEYSGKRATSITLLEPTANIIKHRRRAQQKIMQAIMQSTKNIDKTQAAESVADGVDMGQAILMMVMQSDIDIGDFLEDIESFWVTGCAKINGADNLPIGYLDKITSEDREAMAGVYVENFLQPSVLKTQRV